MNKVPEERTSLPGLQSPEWAKKLSKEIEARFTRPKMPKKMKCRRTVYRFKTFAEADVWWDKMISESLSAEAEAKK